MSRTQYSMVTLIGAAVAAASSGCAQPDDLPDDISKQNVSERSESLLASAGDAQEMLPEHKKWHEVMRRTPKPKEGCFTASYPDTSWQQVPCNDGTREPHLRPGKSMQGAAQPSGPGLEVVGGEGTDFGAQVNGSFTGVTGHFPRVSNVKSETDGTSGNYSLQLNTNRFISPACATAKDSNVCRGWEQFLFENNQDDCSNSYVLIQFWRVNWGKACPDSSWKAYGPSCAKSVYTTIPCQRVTNLTNMYVEAGIYQGMDNVNFSVYDPVQHQSVIWAATASDSTLGLAGHWNFAEFNVFGNAPGSTATFNSGASIDVAMGLDDGTWSSPTCSLGTETLEMNNLSLVPDSCCPTGGPPKGGTSAQSILFRETYPPSTATPYCMLTDVAPIQFPLM